MPTIGRMPRRRLRSILPAVVIVLAACSSDGATSAPAGTPATDPAASANADAPTPAAPATSDSTGDSTGDSAPTPDPQLSTDPPTTVATVPAVTAESLAAEITAVERGIRDPALDPTRDAEALAELGRRQQRAYRQLARHDELDEAVAALLPDDVTEAYRFNVMARQAVVVHAEGRPPTEPSPTLPAWSIAEPAPIDELLGYYAEAEAATAVPWEYLAAINFVETRMGRIGGASSAGAIGPMQFLPETWAACCDGDPTDPHDAIMGAAVYLVSEGAPADMAAALYGYNPNDGYVGQVTAYAANLMADPLAYRGYHGWEVLVGSAAGTVRLPTGYSATEPTDAAAYVAAHPEDLLDG